MKSMKALVGALNTDKALVGTFPNPDLLSTVLYSPKFVFQLALKPETAFSDMISEDAMVSLDMLKAIVWEGL